MILDVCKNVLLLNPVSVLNTLGLKMISIVYKILKIVNDAYWKFEQLGAMSSSAGVVQQTVQNPKIQLKIIYEIVILTFNKIEPVSIFVKNLENRNTLQH